MGPHDLLELLRTRPFVPLRLHISEGRSYDIRHPDQALVLLARVVLGAGGTNGVPERMEYLALSHIVRVEELTGAPADA
jgi:hypothetical protein